MIAPNDVRCHTLPQDKFMQKRQRTLTFSAFFLAPHPCHSERRPDEIPLGKPRAFGASPQKFDRLRMTPFGVRRGGVELRSSTERSDGGISSASNRGLIADKNKESPKSGSHLISNVLANNCYRDSADYLKNRHLHLELFLLIHGKHFYQ